MSDKPATGAVWDWPTRLFHWGLAAAIATSYLSIEFNAIETHLISGGVAGGLILFRVMWGIWGATTAQFHRFVPTPGRLIAALSGRGRPTTGHSALAALSVLAMLIAIAVQVATGMVSDDDIYIEGPLRSEVTSATASLAGTIHAWTSDIILGLIALHVLAIGVYRYRGKPLTRAMITGRGDVPDGPMQPRPLWLALGTMAAAAATILFIYWR